MSFIYNRSIRLPFTSIALSLHRPAPHQRGYWRDRRDAGLTTYGLGAAVLFVER